MGWCILGLIHGVGFGMGCVGGIALGGGGGIGVNKVWMVVRVEVLVLV